jgi:HTH-type transcriptional regulator / antitoxin HigA
MRATRKHHRENLPARFDDLVRLMPPQAIVDEVHHANTVEMIDRLMARERLSPDQALYLETLVQLVDAYEARHHAIDLGGLTGLDSLKHLLDQNGMNASDLALVLGVHVSMGSKILKGERALTVDHLRKLAERFKVSPELFMDA